MLMWLVVKSVQLICDHIVCNPHFLNNVFDPQRTSEEEHSSLFAVLSEMRPHGAVRHESQVLVVDIFFEGLVHLFCLNPLKVAATVGEQRQRNAGLPECNNRVASALNRGRPPNEHPIDIADKQRPEPSLYFDDAADVGNKFVHMQMNIKLELSEVANESAINDDSILNWLIFR
jgi:hypothetical protein